MIEIAWTEINSSTILAINFMCSNTFVGELRVRFKNSKEIYLYQDVPLRKVFNLMTSDSPGSFFSNEIKNVYKYSKI